MAELIINNKNEFDQQVWQYETGFTAEQYQRSIDNFAEVASRIYDIIDQHDDIPVDQADLYQLGDLINMLSCLKVNVEHRGESWTCTRGDFDGYVLDGIDEDEINEMIDHVGHGMQNNGSVSECYWMCIEMEADEHGFQKHEDIVATANMIRHTTDADYQYVFCTICTKDNQERMDANIALHPYDEVSDASHDDDIYFYCNSKDEFFDICMNGADEFTVCAIKDYYTEI